MSNIPDYKREARERYLSALSNLVSGGLYIDERGAPGEAERALLRVSGALLKAVTFATHAEGNEDPRTWGSHSSTLTMDEQREALVGIVSLLQNGPTILSELRANGEFRQSEQRIEYLQQSDETSTCAAARQQGEVRS